MELFGIDLAPRSAQEIRVFPESYRILWNFFGIPMVLAPSTGALPFGHPTSPAPLSDDVNAPESLELSK